MVRSSLVPWTGDALRPFESLRREVDTLFDRFWSAGSGGNWNSVEMFNPVANIAETENAYEVTLELPGMKPEDVTVELKDGQLWITGEKKEEHEQNDKRYHSYERRYGQFQRVMNLGTTVNEDQIDASFKDGILTVSVPKSEAAKPKRIEIKS
jgi:HSP20 family protein